MQIIASDMRLQGIGDIFAALEKLKKAYGEKGYFDPQRKKPLPLLPGRIGVVTSPTGAAVRDIVRILRRRFPGIAIVIYPAKVQGEGAAVEIAAGIDYFNNAGAAEAVDVLIVGRGGGSYEDLWAFNEAPVVEAIYHSRIPVISAVGHETDFTIADFVADLRAATPSAAAELVVGKKDEFLSRIDFLRHGLMRHMEKAAARKKIGAAAAARRFGPGRFPRPPAGAGPAAGRQRVRPGPPVPAVAEPQARPLEPFGAALRRLRPGRPAEKPRAAGRRTCTCRSAPASASGCSGSGKGSGCWPPSWPP